MALPFKLKNMNLFNDANSYQGQTGEVTLPKLGRKFEKWRGGGMNGSVDIDLGLEDSITEMTWKLGGIDPLVLGQWGASTVSAVQLRFAGAYQADDTAEVKAVEVVVRGRHQEIDMGNAKPGDNTEKTIKTIWSYYKLTIDGKEIYEIDIPNFVEKVNGVDIMEKQRKALGI